MHFPRVSGTRFVKTNQLRVVILSSPFQFSSMQSSPIRKWYANTIFKNDWRLVCRCIFPILSYPERKTPVWMVRVWLMGVILRSLGNLVGLGVIWVQFLRVWAVWLVWVLGILCMSVWNQFHVQVSGILSWGNLGFPRHYWLIPSSTIKSHPTWFNSFQCWILGFRVYCLIQLIYWINGM